MDNTQTNKDKSIDSDITSNTDKKINKSYILVKELEKLQ